MTGMDSGHDAMLGSGRQLHLRDILQVLVMH
jgi:hypothetical protein